MDIDLLITDGTYKNTLAAVQSVGKRLSVAAMAPAPKRRAVCNYSRFVKQIIEYDPRIEDDADAYGQKMLELIERLRPKYFLPVGLNSYLAAVAHAKEISSLCRCLLPDPNAMDIAFRKERTMALAKRIGVPCPRTNTISTLSDIDHISDYPVVIKSSDTSGSSIYYCRDRSELERRYGQLSKASRSKVMVQEYFEGAGCGFYGVYCNGQLVDFYMMQRLREFPITGGPASYARSYFGEDIYRYGKMLGDELQWNGPMMVEFKRNTSTGEVRLIEINPKLWGSLAITIKAGVDVPDIIIQILDGKMKGAIASDLRDAHYLNISYRWIFPDDFMVAMSKRSARGICEFINTKQTCSNMSLSDPLPTVFNIGAGLVSGFQVLVNEKKRYPHGRMANVKG